MSPAFSTISFLSDYGTDDEFVGVVKSVVRSIAPEVTVLDITHGVTACDVRAGGLALARASEYMVPSVVLAVVDPGVGTNRRGVAIEVADGAAFLVGPDNGLLAPAVGMVGGATGAVVLDNPEYQLPQVGATFDGRDIFAPAAAHLCQGVPLDELGTRIEPSQLLPGVLPVAEKQDDGSMTAEVLWIDRFGNCQINIDPTDIDGWAENVRISGQSIETRNATQVKTFAEITTGSVGLLADSYGLLMLAIDRGSAATELGLQEGDRLVLASADSVPNVSTPVSLSTKPTADKGSL